MERRNSPWYTSLKGAELVRAIRKCGLLKWQGAQDPLFHSQQAVSPERVLLRGFASGELYRWLASKRNSLFSEFTMKPLLLPKHSDTLFELMRPLLALSYARDKYSSSSLLRIACPFLTVWSPNSPGLQTAWQSPAFRFGFWLQKDLFPTSRPWPRYLLSLELCFLIYKKGVVLSILRTPWVVVRMKWNYVKITWKRQEPCRWPLCRCVLLNTTIQLHPFYLVIFIPWFLWENIYPLLTKGWVFCPQRFFCTSC